jgi:UDP-N-acetylglucosamine pyrophosphorylase
LREKKNFLQKLRREIRIKIDRFEDLNPDENIILKAGNVRTNIILKCFRVTFIAVEKQKVLHITQRAKHSPHYTGRFIVFSVIKNIHNKKNKGPFLRALFTVTGKLKKFFDN